ncbi:MAG TPA: MFS transporter [Terriglobales bacterium]|nr:MFS transporter [Terriglobales bacterium]
MWAIFRQRGLRLIFIANLISMLGSGMNTAAVVWYILQVTHSEMALGTVVILQTLPALLMLPFTGVVIDREDRRHVVMFLDGSRAVVIFIVAALAIAGKARLWELYLMSTLVAAGFWMFWPSVTALIQELTPESQYADSSNFLMAGVQGGWLIAGGIVGFVYNHLHLGGVLLLDFSTYVVSIACYLFVRKGRITVARPESTSARLENAHPIDRYLHELKEGFAYLRHRPAVTLVGISMALFMGAMLTQGIVTAPLADRILRSGAVGYGWLNSAWGTGAFLSTLYTPWIIRRLHTRAGIRLGMLVLGSCVLLAPYSRILAVAAPLFFLMGSARGLGGTSLNTSLMELVPSHLMGRTQNTFYFMGTLLQLGLAFAVAVSAHRIGLTTAYAIIAATYLCACASTLLSEDQISFAKAEATVNKQIPEESHVR